MQHDAEGRRRPSEPRPLNRAHSGPRRCTRHAGQRWTTASVAERSPCAAVAEASCDAKAAAGWESPS